MGSVGRKFRSALGLRPSQVVLRHSHRIGLTSSESRLGPALSSTTNRCSGHCELSERRGMMYDPLVVDIFNRTASILAATREGDFAAMKRAPAVNRPIDSWHAYLAFGKGRLHFLIRLPHAYESKSRHSHSLAIV